MVSENEKSIRRARQEAKDEYSCKVKTFEVQLAQLTKELTDTAEAAQKKAELMANQHSIDLKSTEEKHGLQLKEKTKKLEEAGALIETLTQQIESLSAEIA